MLLIFHLPKNKNKIKNIASLKTTGLYDNTLENKQPDNTCTSFVGPDFAWLSDNDLASAIGDIAENEDEIEINSSSSDTDNSSESSSNMTEENNNEDDEIAIDNLNREVPEKIFNP